MKILIADTPGPFRDALCAQLRPRHTVVCCDDGKIALQKIRDQQPDILLLDVCVSGYDGLSMLQALSFSVFMPRVLVITSFLSDHIVNELQRLRIDHILQKPVTVCAAMAQINSLICECDKEDIHDRYRKIHQLLHTMSFRRCCAGYDCVLEAMYLVRYQSMRMMTKELYPAVAKVCGGTRYRVEKAIRDCIHDAWQHRDDSVWRIYFPCDRGGNVVCPSNFEFLLAFSDDYVEQAQMVNFL